MLGGGPAGSLAAIRARLSGADVQVVERSSFPRHKVCGEFFSPEILPVLERAGVLQTFLDMKPSTVRRLRIVLGEREKSAALPEAAYGLSRFTYDHLLWREAMRLGCTHLPERSEFSADVVAAGRPAGTSAKGKRLFGFKAHFDGPANDAVELFFLRDAYIGLNCVEGGRTNVCGLAPEAALRSSGFSPEAIFERSTALRERVRPLQRSMKWLFTGPLEFEQRLGGGGLLAGDALSFVDPFTGSGLLCAALTGSLAGVHAAEGVAVSDHVRACRAAISRPFLFSSLLRTLASTAWAEYLLPFVPGWVLYRLTRPTQVRV